VSTFERVRNLGSGFFGEVWLERDMALGRLCAVKYLPQTNAFRDRDAFAEAAAMVMAEHDNVLKIYSADIVDGTPVIRMEYVRGGSIQDRFAGEPLPVLDAINAVEDTCRALEFFHTRGWLHRDIKPANLMQTDSGRVKVSDFGLACGKDQVASAPIGYVTHLPPESIGGSGHIESVAGDIYATGVTLYRLVNGDALFHGVVGPDADIVALIQKGKLPRRDRFLPHLHDGLRRVVRKAINVNPDRRYASASELRHALEAARPAVSDLRKFLCS
jgi:serine/threonine-protein kinase